MTDDIKDVDEQSFNNILSNEQRIFAVQFYTPTCTTCHALLKTCVELSNKHKGKFMFARINAQTNPALAIRFGVLGVPSFRFFKSGKLIGELTGSISSGKLSATVDTLVQKH
jgi:thioredoxin-like negative regulator of GroEL